MELRDIWRLDATAQAGLVRAGEVTPGELIEVAIARIERLNPRLNAVVTPLYDDARRDAAAGGSGPFAGVPMLLKDASIEVEGTPYCVGTRVLHDIGYRSTQTTEMALRLRRAGFVFAGKTNVPELSAGITTEPVAFGPARNPWDLERSTGGSSGGSAAAVAAGMTSLAHGADGTGSLRYPAACCGVATLKPTRGLMPLATPAGTPDLLHLWTEFVLARSIRDLAGVLEVVAGMAGDLDAPLRPQRVGLLTSDVMAGIPTDAACVVAVERTGALLAARGHHVEEAHPPALDGLFHRTMGAMNIAGRIARYAQIRWLGEIIGRPITQDDVEPDSFVAQADAEAVTGMQLADAVDTITRETRPINDWWASGYDILVTPTLRQPAWPLQSNKGAIDAGVFPGAFSFSGQPAVSLPLHWTPDGLPVGVQLIAAVGRDELLLRLAAQLETTAPWADRWPTIATA